MRMSTKALHTLLCSVVLLLTGFAMSAQATSIMPDFTDVPTGWVTDRYQPDSFTNVGTYQGRTDVLGIGIDAADGLDMRSGGYSSGFYNTQGMKHSVSGGAGDSISAALYIPSEWADEANGTRRTDMWGVMTDGAGVSGYPIIGFVNDSDNARYRVWEDDTGWIDLAIAVMYDTWTAFDIMFTGTSYDFLINGSLVYSDTTTNGSVGFQDVIMQAYNYNGVSGYQYDQGRGDYVAYWDNVEDSSVPVPAPLALMALGLVGIGFTTKHRRSAQQ